jgi:hypothetical protein
VIIAAWTNKDGKRRELTAASAADKNKMSNVKLAYEIIAKLQVRDAPHIFESRAAYDGNKLLYARSLLKFPNNVAEVS